MSTELKKLADDHRTAAENQAKLLAANSNALVSPLTPPSRMPIPRRCKQCPSSISLRWTTP